MAERVATKRDRVLAVVCELWCWLGPFALLSLVLRFTVARHEPFLRRVTTEVLNLQIAAAVPTVVGVVAVLTGWNLVAISAWALFASVAAYGYVVGAVGAVKAWRGTAWKYPMNLHLVKS